MKTGGVQVPAAVVRAAVPVRVRRVAADTTTTRRRRPAQLPMTFYLGNRAAAVATCPLRNRPCSTRNCWARFCWKHSTASSLSSTRKARRNTSRTMSPTSFTTGHKISSANPSTISSTTETTPASRPHFYLRPSVTKQIFYFKKGPATGDWFLPNVSCVLLRLCQIFLDTNVCGCSSRLGGHVTFDWGRPRPSYQGSMNKLGWSGRQDQTRLPSLSYGFASQQNAIAPSQFQMFDACCLSLQLGRARWRRRRRTESAVVSTVACWCSRWASRTRRWKRSSSGWNIMKTCRSRPSSNRIQGTANSHRPTTRETAGRRQQPLRPPLSGWTLPTWSWHSPPWLQLGRR